MSWTIIWIELNLLDLALTWLAIELGASEANIIINWFNVDSLPEFALWKIAFVFASLVFIAALNRPQMLRSERVLQLASVLLFVVCMWNWFVLYISSGNTA